MSLPVVVVALLGASEMAEAQARLRPPHVRLGAVDPGEHDRLVKRLHEELALARMPPEMAHVLRAGRVCGLQVAHAPVADGL